MATLTKKIIMTESSGLIAWLKSIAENLLVFTAPIIVIIYKCFDFLNKREESRALERREHIKEISKEVAKEVVKEVLDSTLPKIQIELHDFKKDTRADFEKIHERIDDVYRDMKK